MTNQGAPVQNVKLIRKIYEQVTFELSHLIQVPFFSYSGEFYHTLALKFRGSLKTVRPTE
jgi:hypothetical protein